MPLPLGAMAVGAGAYAYATKKPGGRAHFIPIDGWRTDENTPDATEEGREAIRKRRDLDSDRQQA